MNNAAAQVFLLTVNAGTAAERQEVVRPLAERDGKTLVSFIRGSRVATKWVASDRVQLRD